jgi:hypothetical protein
MEATTTDPRRGSASFYRSNKSYCNVIFFIRGGILLGRLRERLLSASTEIFARDGHGVEFIVVNGLTASSQNVWRC